MHGHAAHSPACHCTVPTAPEQLKSLRIALVLVTCFSGLELWVSARSHSLSLMADAGHMAADVLAIALSLWAASLAARPEQTHTARLNAMAALVNGGLLLLVGSWLGWEALAELRSPPTEILSRPVAITAAVGLCVNGLNAYFLHSHAEDNLNLRGAFLHILADAASCLGVLLGALLIANFQWFWADGVVSVAIALLILTVALPLICQSWRALRSPEESSPSPLENPESADRLVPLSRPVSLTQASQSD